MALDSYSNLQSAVIEWSHREDVVDKLDDFIQIAEEAMFANPMFPLQLRQMETRATATASTSSRFLALPTGFINMRRLKLNLSGGDCDVKYRAPDQMVLVGSSGIPSFFTVTSQIEFDRVPDSDYTVDMQYFAKPTGLSASNTTNIILDNHATVYLYGCLWALAEWSNDHELEARYLSRFLGVIEGINKQYKSGRYGPAPVMRIEGATP